MKILWFTNTACSASAKLSKNSQSGGWLASLEKHLSQREDISLSICFYSDQALNSFELGRTFYAPVFRKGTASKFSRWIKRGQSIVKNDAKELQQLLNVIHDIKPDLIHVHGTEENFGLILNHTTIPVVISIQGILGPITEKFYAGLPKSVVNKFEGPKLKALMKSSGIVHKSLQERAKREKEILKNAKFIIGRTDWDRNVTRLLASKSKYFVSNEILRHSFYSCAWQANKNHKIRIVTILSSALYKGLETIVKTASLLLTSTEINLEWSIIGIDEEDKIVSIVKKWIEVDTRQLNINFLGPKDENGILQSLLKADIYCQVSHIENSPNSLCEAMLLGMPVVATSVGGTSSLLQNKKEGLLVQEGEPYSLAGAICELNSDWNAAIEYGKSARTKAQSRHAVKTIVNDLVSNYSQIIN